MAITLRPYQQLEIIDPLVLYLCENPGKNPVCAAPTGTGKSLTMNAFVRQSLEEDPSLRFMCIAHVKEIISQNVESMLTYWPRCPYGVYSAGLKMYQTTQNVIYAGIQSVHNKASQFGMIDAVIADEAHMISPKEETTWRRFLNDLKKINPDLRVIGFTATPYRLSLGCITEGGLFDDVAVDLTTTDRINQFVSEGFLAPLISKKPAFSIDLTNVAMKGGEFDEHSLQEATDTDDLNTAVVTECIKYGVDRNHWLVFATGVTHAEHLQQRFRSKGVSCEIVHGELSVSERTRLIGNKTEGTLGAFQKGEIRCLVNVGVLTTGFDFPNLDLIALARATQSTGLYVQMLGRGTRPADNKKNCLILDFARNIVRLGPFNCPVIPRARRKGEKIAGEAPVKTCPQCDTDLHTRTVVCPHCGYEFPPASCIEGNASTEKVMIESSTVPIIELFDILSTIYREHTARDGSTCIRVSYCTMTQTYNEYFKMNTGIIWLQKKLSDFWTGAGGKGTTPQTVEDFLSRTGELREPKRIEVVTNKKFPDVVKKHYQ